MSKKEPTPLSKRDDHQCPFCLANLNLEKSVKTLENWDKTLDNYKKDELTLADNSENEDDLHYNVEIILVITF